MSNLSADVITEVRDLIAARTSEASYTTRKQALIKQTSISEQKRLEQFLAVEELSDRTPTQFLRHTQSLLGNKTNTVNTSLLRQIFLSRLPVKVRLILSAAEDLGLYKLAALVDKIMEVPASSNSTMNVHSTGNHAVSWPPLSGDHYMSLLTLSRYPAHVWVALADELTHSGSYSRICVPLAEPDLPGLTVILASVTACPQELDCSDIWHFKNALLISLFDAVATSYVSSLRVIVPNDPGAKGVLFCKMLKKVGNLRCMDLVCRELFSRKVFRAVALNSSIDRLIISIVDPVYLRTAEALSYMLAHNESLTEVSVYTAKNCFGESAARGIARALSQNRRITHLSLPFTFRTDSSDSFAILEALRNNHRDLHRAIHFAIHPTADRLCAEAFELLCGSPVFGRQLVAVGGAPQAEVTRILNSARNYLLDNYLVIAGVVRQNVVRCHPSSAATQADALTNDCSRAIARYLKVSDVILN
ncbi:hypothetical protein HPB49_019584 [Dermacentor silvarum]|uniref:Uncharacterized protein n=1 Tax=Dermacentor silvarum TaxID=543639 RepID=A0ACB8E2V6_DERSI|nr:hypothetical protein HPB49_019584 [Dermacentor silvarum]